MYYKEAIAHLNGFINFERLPEPRYNTQLRDLARFRNLLRELGDPQSDYPIIHIAGTKGKGSTVAILSSILRTAGYHVGVYTSPHLVTVRERMRVNGRMVSKPEFACLLSRINKVSASVNSTEKQTYRTVFEYLTAMALLWFSRRKIDVAIIEAGLGGRLDATVVIDPVMTIITPIGLDHTAVLGYTVSAIAADKAYVIKAGVPAVSARQIPEAQSELVKRAQEVSTLLIFATGRSEFELLSSSFRRQIFRTNREWLGKETIHMNLPGRFQLDNISTVLTTVEKLKETFFNLTPQDVRDSLKKINLPGRMQFKKGKPSVILDVSHNVMSMEALLESLSELIGGRKLYVVFSAMRSKPVRQMLKLLSATAEKFYLAPISFPKGMSSEELRSEAQTLGISNVICENIPSAFDLACREAGQKGVVLATGSLYLTGEVIRHSRGLPAPPLDGRIDDRI